MAFSWHPGQPPERASQVEITFAAAGGQTLVTLEHTGWEAFADPAAARAQYDQGWPVVLDCYRCYAAAPAEDTWVALLHRPGPDAPATGTVFEDPRFAGHVAFLNRMREAGFLVAAPGAAPAGFSLGLAALAIARSNTSPGPNAPVPASFQRADSGVRIT